ncbi:enoyl-CoA hydratase-related protein [Amycolatopsis acidiphila]|uniref:Enoyl-CoA hydratase n=1 Tax=Amycolatopsis acidiphila TaxID=715473 RepID=A0A558AA64_9PSEU|nr:enoyl-CoA hydratase-related protein [Amycolatopsis acidiphila]TVT21158.1 enoyl-CoA hydratase [Amycolatopsis acidiphila]UIJ57246.1 enoyl-CoA hydratase-related protein [Amycolatopsis acidiphila]GHG52426.1 enoyl-CoA hydratase [Amycolatopsis acidiphila]
MSVLVQRHDAVTVVTINRPEARNALDAETMAGIGEALVAAEQDAEVRAVVLTGAGDRAFCAGMDLRAFAAGGAVIDESRPGLEVFTERVYPKPVIAAVNGTAVAGGFELVLACDLAVVAEHAKFGLPEVKRGLVAAGGGTNLPRRIPLALALELALTGETFDAARAAALGLVNRVVPGDQVLAEALALANTIARNGPLALRVTKELMLAQAQGAGREEIASATAAVFASADAKEGATAFAEKREPRWTGA